ncbi:MAG: PEGA domain-containing protein [Candidatus Hydrogenedentota bacterium]
MNHSGRSLLLLFLLILFSSCTPTRLAVTSTPTGAVEIDGRERGMTPVTIETESGRTHDIVVSAAGYENWRSRVRVERDQEVHAILTRTPPPVTVKETVEVPTASRTRLAVFVEPDGGEVWVDGKSRGMARADRPVEVVYTTNPTLADVVVTREGFRKWTRSVDLESGRENRVIIRMEPLAAWYTFTSDAEMLRNTVSQVVSSTANLPSLDRSSKIAVLSIAHGEGSDEPLQSLLDDAFITTLAQAGFSPAENDDHMLVQLAHSASGDSIPINVITDNKGPDRPFVYDAEIATKRTERAVDALPVTITSSVRTTTEDDDVTTESTTIRTETVMKERTRQIPITAYIPTADQFLAYRVLDCGISKTPIEEGEAREENMLYRRAELRVHLRVINAKTGIITWAGFLTGRTADEIPVRVSMDLANPPNRMYADPLPDSWQKLRHPPSRRVNMDVPAVVSPTPR